MYALLKLTTQTLGLISTAADFGIDYKATVQTDSSAAMGIASRTGLGGKSRHISVQFLWIQDCIKSDKVKLCKVNTSNNVADAMTKYLDKENFDKFVSEMGYYFINGRAEESRRLNVLKAEASVRGGV